MIGSKIALIGDLHLGVNKNSPDFYELSKKWIEYFIEECGKYKINHVFVLGDWHHYRDEISLKTLDISYKIMDMFPKNMNVHILTGNHDCYFKDNSDIHSLQMFKNWENIHVYDKSEIIKTRNNKKIGVVPWGCENEEIENVNYIFGHFEIKNFKMNNYSICSKGMDSSSLIKKGADVYTGHFHKYQFKKYKNGSITYVGSPFQHDFNDVDNVNGFHILDTESNKVNFVKNDETFPQFKYIKLSKLKNFDIDEIRNNYVKLLIDSDITEESLEKLIIKLNSKKPIDLIIDDISIKKDVDNMNLNDNMREINIKSSINEFIDKMDDFKYKEEILNRIEKYYEKNKTK